MLYCSMKYIRRIHNSAEYTYNAIAAINTNWVSDERSVLCSIWYLQAVPSPHEPLKKFVRVNAGS